MAHKLNTVGVNKVIQSVIMPTALFVLTYANCTERMMGPAAAAIRKLARHFWKLKPQESTALLHGHAKLGGMGLDCIIDTL